MGVGTPKHGTLEHGKLKVGRAALQDGEKPRPNYHGATVILDQKPSEEGEPNTPRSRSNS
jgi:hypothetical protein